MPDPDTVTRRRQVEAILLANDMDPRDVEPETFAFWLASSKTPTQVAALLLGYESSLDMVMKQ